jgi:hypothetical protein
MRIDRISSALVVISLILGACSATQPAAIQAKEISPEQFRGYSCNQLGGLYRNKISAADKMEAELKRRADHDEDLTSLWMVTGLQMGAYNYSDGPLTNEYAEIKGNIVAIELVMIENDCPDLPF